MTPTPLDWRAPYITHHVCLWPDCGAEFDDYNRNTQFCEAHREANRRRYETSDRKRALKRIAARKRRAGR